MTSNKYIADLLKPRRKVIAPFPNMHSYGLEVGDIIIDPDNKGECCRFVNGDAAFTMEWELYPHLFKKLQWWEGRTPEEMPEYLLHEKSKEVFKIVSINYKYMACFLHDDTFPRSFVNFLPATEQDYLNYLNSKK